MTSGLGWPATVLSRANAALAAVPGLSSTALGSYAMVAGQLLRTLVLARLLGPSAFGVLNLANTTANLTSLADFGTGVVGDQLASQARGRGDVGAAEELQRRSGGARMFSSLVVTVALLVVATAVWATGRTALAQVALFVAVSCPLQAAWFAVRGYLRVSGLFGEAVRAQVWQVALWLTVVPAATWFFGLGGAFTSIALSFVAPVCASARVVPLRAVLRPRAAPFRRWFSAGVPLWLGLVSAFVYTNVDQFVIGATLGTGAVGVFAIGLLVSTALTAFSDGAAAAAHPQTLQHAARDGAVSIDTPSIWRTVRICQAAFGLLVPLSWVGLALVTVTVLPAYTSSLAVVAFLGPAAAALGVTTATNAALLAAGRHRRVWLMFLGAASAKTVLTLVLLQLWPSVRSVAVAGFLGSMVFLALYLRSTARALGVQRPRSWIFFHLLSPALLAVLGLGVALCLDEWGSAGFAGASVLATAVSAAVHSAMWRRYRAVGRR